MKILFVLENYPPYIGGVEVLFKNLSEGLAKLGHDVNIVTHRLKETKKFEIINGVRVHRIPCFHSRYLFTYLSIPKVLSLAKKADIIHTTTFNGAFPAWVASKLLKKPSLITIHEVWVGKWNKLTEMSFVNARIHDFLERLIYMLNFDRFVCVSNSTKKQLLEIKKDKNKIGIIYNGVDYAHWSPRKYKGDEIRRKLGLKNKFVYLFTGRPGISKGLRYLIQAVPSISKKIPNSKLLAIVSEDRAYLKRRNEIIGLIEKLGVENNVVMIEPVPFKELPRYVKAADCVVVPSLSEGFGFAAAEACAMNKPVVASNTTSLPEVVFGRYVLVKPESPEEIACGIELIYSGKVKKKKKKIFKWDNAIKGYLSVYKKLIKGR